MKATPATISPRQPVRTLPTCRAISTTLAPGETVSVRLYVRTKVDVRDGHISDNEVTVTGDTLDGDSQPYTDFDQVFMVFGNVSDLMIRKFGKPDGQAGAGEALVYTILVDNFGPGVTDDVVVTDLMASNGSYTSDAPGCTPNAGTGSGNTTITRSRDASAPGAVADRRHRSGR